MPIGVLLCAVEDFRQSHTYSIYMKTPDWHIQQVNWKKDKDRRWQIFTNLS